MSYNSNQEENKYEGTWIQSQFTQNQLINFYVSFLRYVGGKNKLDTRPNSEQKDLYGLPDTKCSMQLLLNRLMNSGTEKQVVDAAFVLMFRTVSVFGLGSLTLHTVPRLLFSSLVIANICFEDDYVQLSYWQRMSNCAWTLDEMKHMVYEQLTILKYMARVEQHEINFFWHQVLIPYYEHNFDDMQLDEFVNKEFQILHGDDFTFPQGQLTPSTKQRVTKVVVE